MRRLLSSLAFLMLAQANEPFLVSKSRRQRRKLTEPNCDAQTFVFADTMNVTVYEARPYKKDQGVPQFLPLPFEVTGGTEASLCEFRECIQTSTKAEKAYHGFIYYPGFSWFWMDQGVPEGHEQFNVVYECKTTGMMQLTRSTTARTWSQQAECLTAFAPNIKMKTAYKLSWYQKWQRVFQVKSDNDDCLSSKYKCQLFNSMDDTFKSSQYINVQQEEGFNGDDDPYYLMIKANWIQNVETLRPKCTYDGHAVDSPADFDLEIGTPCLSEWSLWAKGDKNANLKSDGFELTYYPVGSEGPNMLSIKASDYFTKDSTFQNAYECPITTCDWHWSTGMAETGFSMKDNILSVQASEVYDAGTDVMQTVTKTGLSFTCTNGGRTATSSVFSIKVHAACKDNLSAEDYKMSDSSTYKAGATIDISTYLGGGSKNQGAPNYGFKAKDSTNCKFKCETCKLVDPDSGDDLMSNDETLAYSFNSGAKGCGFMPDIKVNRAVLTGLTVAFKLKCSLADGYDDITSKKFTFTVGGICDIAANVKMVVGSLLEASTTGTYNGFVPDKATAEFTAAVPECPITARKLVIGSCVKAYLCKDYTGKAVEIKSDTGVLVFYTDAMAGVPEVTLKIHYTQAGNNVPVIGTAFTYSQTSQCFDGLRLKNSNVLTDGILLVQSYDYNDGVKTIQVQNLGFDTVGCALSCTVETQATAEAAWKDASKDYTFSKGELKITTDTFAGKDQVRVRLTCKTTYTGTKTFVTGPIYQISQKARCTESDSIVVSAVTLNTVAYDKGYGWEAVDSGIKKASDGCHLTCKMLQFDQPTKANAKYTGDKFMIEADDGLLYMKMDTALGYEEKINYSCANKYGVSKWNLVSAKQTTSCLSSFVDGGINGSWTVPRFDYKTTQTLTANGLTSEDAKGNCKVTTCELQSFSISKGYVKYAGDKVTMELVHPFRIKFNSAYPDSYSEKFYVKCSNGDQDLRSKEYSIKQDHPCKDTVTGTDIEDQVLPFARNTPFAKIEMSAFMSSSDNDLCKISKCILLKEGNPYVNDQVKIHKYSDNNYGLWMMTDYNPRSYTNGGYKKTGFEISCYNGLVWYTHKKDFSVQQLRNPCMLSLSQDDQEKPADFTGAAALKYSADVQWTADVSMTEMHANREVLADCKETCKIYESDCRTEQEIPKRFRQDQADQYKFGVLQNYAEGYEKEMCFGCKNKDGETTTKFSSKQILRCHERLTPKLRNVLPIEGNKDTDDDENVLWYTGKTGWVTHIADTADHFFNNQNSDSKCPITTCRLMQLGCAEEAVATANVRLHQYPLQSTWKLEVDLNKPYGYVEHYCVQCTNGNKDFARQTINYDKFRIQLPSVCNRAMTVNETAPTTFVIDHEDDDVDNTKHNLVPAFNAFFKQKDETNCPVKSCTLLKAGCQSPHSAAGMGENIAMAETSPWTITIMDNVLAGYTPQKMCVMCDNEYQKIYSDDISVSQTARCIDKITAKAWTQSAPWEYVKDAPVKTFTTGFADFVTNNDMDKANFCNPTSCSLKKSDCTTNWDTVKNAGIGMNPTTKALKHTQQLHGFNYKACVSCSNKYNTVTSPFTVIQKDICHNDYEHLQPVPDPAPVEGEDPLKNHKVYKSEYNQELNSWDIGFNGTAHALVEEGENLYTQNVTYKKWFTNADTVNCGYDKCELMSKGCEYPYTATTHIKIGKTAPWTVSALSDVAEGYNTTFCVKCSNIATSITQDDIVVTQAGKTNWTMIYVLVAVAIWLTIGFGCFCFGKLRGTGASVSEAEGRSNHQARQAQKDKVVNKDKENEADIVEPPVERVELAEFHQDEMEVGRRPDISDDDAPESVQSASFYRKTAIPAQIQEDAAGFGTERALNDGGDTNRGE